MSSINENPNDENIKCVVIGDNNVGKTRLVCARAYMKYGPNNGYQRYGGHHIPTVWANDHYRNDFEILNNARDCVDAVDVSLRLWDTFGDHNKNRRFSYGRADVILMCFSVCDPKSLKNIVKFWLPEVRRHSKFTPVLLVACKVDLRFANLEELNKNKNSLVKKIKLADILFPEICRQNATEIGCPYYETSVCNGHGVKEVFENAIRAALIHRRKMYLYWKPSLKHVQKPLFVEPLMPPKSAPPVFPAPGDTALLDFSFLYNDNMFSDIIIICQNVEFHAHKAILATASNVFHRLFSICCTTPDSHQVQDQTPEEGSITPNNNVYIVTMRADEHDVKESPEKVKVCDHDDSPPNLLAVRNKDMPELGRVTFDPPHRDGYEYHCPDTAQFEFLQAFMTADRNECEKDILHLKPNVSKFSFQNILSYCYRGHFNAELSSSNWLKKNIHLFTELFVTSEQFGIFELTDILTELLNEVEDRNSQSFKNFVTSRKHSIVQNVLWKDTYSDVTFKVDDGILPGHKAFLVCGCDMMSAMLGGTFVESEHKEILLPGTTVSSLQMVFEFIYTKSAPSFGNHDIDYNDLLALSDRFCLPKLTSLLEHHIINDFTEKSSGWCFSAAVCESVILSLENAQIHNAGHLSEWCLHYLATNYNDACKKSKMMKSLSVENQKILETSRWPPVWYIKDRDYYEKACKKRALQEREGKGKNRGSKKI